MQNDIHDLVEAEVLMLNQGKILEALDTFYDDDCLMYDNDELFSTGKAESRAKQEPFITPCTSINGNISEYVVKDGTISVLRNKSSFTHPKFGDNAIDGLHVQYWNENKIVKEYYYHDKKLNEKVSEWLK